MKIYIYFHLLRLDFNLISDSRCLMDNFFESKNHLEINFIQFLFLINFIFIIYLSSCWSGSKLNFFLKNLTPLAGFGEKWKCECDWEKYPSAVASAPCQSTSPHFTQNSFPKCAGKSSYFKWISLASITHNEICIFRGYAYIYMRWS